MAFAEALRGSNSVPRGDHVFERQIATPASLACRARACVTRRTSTTVTPLDCSSHWIFLTRDRAVSELLRTGGNGARNGRKWCTMFARRTWCDPVCILRGWRLLYGCCRCCRGSIVCSCSRVVFPIDRVDRVSCRQDSRVLTGRSPSDWRARRNGRSQPRCSAPSGDRLVLLVQVLSRGV